MHQLLVEGIGILAGCLGHLKLGQYQVTALLGRIDFILGGLDIIYLG